MMIMIMTKGFSLSGNGFSPFENYSTIKTTQPYFPVMI